MAFRGLAGFPCPTPLFSSISFLEIGRKDEQCLLINDHFERRLLTWKCHQNMSGFISMCFLEFCRDMRERDREGFF